MPTAAVTGSASGIGAAIHTRLEGSGWRVVGVDLAGEEVEADLSTADGRRAAIEAVGEASGGVLDATVVCAGLGPHVESGRQIVAVNYYGAVELLDGLLSVLQRGEAPAAVAMVSNSIGLVPHDHEILEFLLDGTSDEALDRAADLEGFMAYGLSKVALARAVRRRVERWASAGVRLNAVAPGPVDTPLLQGSIDHPEIGEHIGNFPIPIGRFGRPEEIAGVVEFLLGPDASLVHGSLLFADGGTDAMLREQHT